MENKYIANLLALSCMTILSAGFAFEPREAAAKDNAQDTKPVVFFVLDTSGSMNQNFGSDGSDSSRMSKALGELVGHQILGSDGHVQWIKESNPKVKYPEWSCANYTSYLRCKFEEIDRTLPMDVSDAGSSSTIAAVPIKVANPNYYYQDGIIQSYINSVRFGFAGMGIGSKGSSGGKDSPIQLVAAAAGGRTKGVLRFTLIWNNYKDTASNYDLDSHTQVWRNGNSIAHIYYSSKSNNNFKDDSSRTYNILDVDNTHPISNKHYYKSNEKSYPEFNNKPVGIENTAWINTSGMKTGDIFDFYVTSYSAHESASYCKNTTPNDNAYSHRGNCCPEFASCCEEYRCCGNKDETSGFTVEIAFGDVDCPDVYTFEYKGIIDWSSDNNRYESYNKHYVNLDVAKVRYLGDGKFEIIGLKPVDKSEGTYAIYKEGTEELYNSNIKSGTKAGGRGDHDYIYGYETRDVAGIAVGRKDLDTYKYKGSYDCGWDVGMWDSNPNAAAPLIYPTPLSDDASVKASNESLIQRVRTYVPNASTPIGEVLADLYFMFGLDSSDYSTTDKGLTQIQTGKTNDTIKPYSDAKLAAQELACSHRAVIFITDGGPAGSGIPLDHEDDKPENFGHAQKVWYDAYHLYEKDIKVYVVGYADFTAGDNATVNARKVLNKMAWQGGTCIGTDGKIISPDLFAGEEAKVREEKFDAMMKASGHDCFYNASDSDALRQAVSTVLAEITRGVISKSKMVTSTALGYVTNTEEKTVDGKKSYTYTSGYYSIRSGYEKTFGPIRHTKLQRDTTKCDHSDGQFKTNPDDMLDFGEVLQNNVIDKCAPNNNCMSYRNIFAGDYSSDQYKLNPDNVHISNSKFGLISGKHLLSSNNDTLNCSTDKNTVLNNTLRTDDQLFNMYLSPYECVNDQDCPSEDIIKVCDLGRCVMKTEYDALANCTRHSGSSLCIGGKLRTDAGKCKTHNECGESGVCFSGQCTNGILKSCDIRPFAASLPLGTIEYGSPVPVEPPTKSYTNASYNKYASQYWLRDSILLVPANDGMLHAFVLGQNHTDTYASSAASASAKLDSNITPASGTVPTDYSEGNELWAYMPKATMNNARTLLDFGDTSRMNATPTVADINSFKEDSLKNTWRTVAVGGFNSSTTPGYYALDITSPGSPKILWEIDNTWTYNGEQPFKNMGVSKSEPVITNMEIKVGEKTVIEPVAILSGGAEASVSSGSTNDVGHAVYIVRLFPDTPKDLLVGIIKTKGAVTGSPAVYPNSFNAVAQRLYFGDSTGHLYAQDLTKYEYNPRAEAIEPVFGPTCFTPFNNVNFGKIVFKPAVSKFSDNSILIAFGTGDNDILKVESENNYFAQVIDEYGKDDYGKDGWHIKSHGKVLVFDVLNKLNKSASAEYETLCNAPGTPASAYTFTTQAELYSETGVINQAVGTHQKLTGAPITFNFSTYFPTYNSTKADSAAFQCSYDGNAAIFKINNSNGSHRILRDNVQNASTSGLTKHRGTENEFSYMDLPKYTKIYGLQITRQMYCQSNDPNKPSQNVAPQLIAQVGDKAGASSTSDILKSNSSIATLSMDLDAMQPTVTPVSWASSYE